AIYAMNVAQNIHEFSQAVDLIYAPQLNLAYADVEGNIGLFISGRVPIRKNGNGQLPVKGWTGEYDWERDIPLSEMPKSVNPKQGYLITCNNKIVDDSYPFFLGNSYMNGFRAQRIENIFSSTDKITIEQCQELHQDFYSIPAEIFIKGMISGLRTAKPKVQKILDVLLSWDFILTTDSSAATVYQVLMYKIVRNLVEDDLGKDLTDKYMGVGEHPVLLPTSELLGHTTQAIFNVLQNSNSKWITSSKEILHLLEKSMIGTCQWLEDSMGYEVEDWKWGKIHHAEFRHGMSVKAPLDKILNVGPYPIGGDTDTVCQTAYNPAAPYHASEWSPSIRLIMDVGEWDNSLMVSPPGQSGVLGSKHYSDMAEKWIEGEYIPMLWSRSKVEASAKKVFTLIPEGYDE
ncbi:MAG: penicillin acylase family protein, partial [Candidatus Marinimicrobia bacterium]|nr:penicillin acylase family protein [Candidatus Neomarinimicrobiota bacterium]